MLLNISFMAKNEFYTIIKSYLTVEALKNESLRKSFNNILNMCVINKCKNEIYIRLNNIDLDPNYNKNFNKAIKMILDYLQEFSEIPELSEMFKVVIYNKSYSYELRIGKFK